MLQPEIRVSERSCFSIPANCSFEDAATFGSAYLPAWHMLIALAKLKPGEFVLIHMHDESATAALQIAVQMRCHVLAASLDERRLAIAKELGAKHVFDGRADFVKELRIATGKHGVDVAIDSNNGVTWIKTLACLARGGRLVTSGGSAGTQTHTDLQRIFWNHLKIYGSSLGSREDLNQVLRFVQSTGTRPHTKKVFPWRDLAAAQKLASEPPLGSIIVRRGI
jgi:NADPH:quinone reductase-like Zn-dependent oxidoreductase